MSNRPRQDRHSRYKSRITSLLATFEKEADPEYQAHNAKYLAVLVSGYLEQAIKELLLHYVSQGSRQQISRYVENTWPISKNMNTGNINSLLNHFNTTWSDKFMSWLEQEESRKGHINSIIEWRNSIAHGQESNTTGVTLVSVRNAFSTVTSLVLFIENLVKT